MIEVGRDGGILVSGRAATSVRMSARCKQRPAIVGTMEIDDDRLPESESESESERRRRYRGMDSTKQQQVVVEMSR